VSLRGNPVEERTVLPDGREARVRVGVPDDPYIERPELDTVALEVWVGGERAVTLNTTLDADHDGEGRRLALDVVRGLESGELEPTGGDLEPLALAARSG
jgi:hypothetical protein